MCFEISSESVRRLGTEQLSGHSLTCRQTLRTKTRREVVGVILFFLYCRPDPLGDRARGSPPPEDGTREGVPRKCHLVAASEVSG